VRGASRRRAGWLLLATAGWLLGCPVGYGEVRDQSRFVSAVLSDDGHTAVFTAQRLRYRPAVGWRAFPDGGIPKYVEDEHVIGRVDIRTGESRILLDERNRDWAHGHGAYHVQQMSGDVALLGRGGQLRGDFALDHRSYLLDASSGRLVDLELASRLAAEGRATGYAHLVRDDGLLVLITPSLAESEQYLHWNRERSVVPEIWIRRPDGALRRVAASDHYEGFRDGRVHYWRPDDRRHRAYDVASGETRLVENPRFSSKTVRLAVGVASGGRALEVQRKQDDGWSRSPLTVEGAL
jgi:hypothetical protein